MVQSVQSDQWRSMSVKSCFLSMEEKPPGNDITPDNEAITMEGNMGRVNLMLMFGGRLHVVVD